MVGNLKFQFCFRRWYGEPWKEKLFLHLESVKVGDCYFGWQPGGIPFQLGTGFGSSLAISLPPCRSLSSPTGCAGHLESPGGLLELWFGGDLVKQGACNIKLWCLDASALTLWQLWCFSVHLNIYNGLFWTGERDPLPVGVAEITCGKSLHSSRGNNLPKHVWLLPAWLFLTQLLPKT